VCFLAPGINPIGEVKKDPSVIYQGIEKDYFESGFYFSGSAVVTWHEFYLPTQWSIQTRLIACSNGMYIAWCPP
jgi:hypothetical protein